jgi:hypothetical protein
MLEFCEELKNLSPEQRYALLVGANMYVPRNSCPDEVIIREDGPGHLVNSIKNLLGVAEA